MEYKQKIFNEYKEKYGLYREFSFVVKNILEQFINNQNIRFQNITNRAKDLDKLYEKIDRKEIEGNKYKKIEDIEDLARVRIVFYLKSDETRFLEIFQKYFYSSILKKEIKYESNGYRGTHIIFKLNLSRTRLPEYKKYKGLKSEIQVTTILYHAWSEVEHDIIYKPKGDPKLLRTLGLDDLERSFEKLMTKHIQAATLQLDYINKKYEEIRKAGEIFGADFVNDIISSDSNDEIYEKLEIIEKFNYKKPNETLAIVDAILKLKPIKPKTIFRFKNQDIYGKNHKDIIIKAIDLISSIRYHKPDEVLQILSKLSLYEDQEIKQKALETVKAFARYDFSILTKTKIGYGVQRKILDYILSWPKGEKLKNFDFIEVIAKELLSLSFEGTTTGLSENDNLTIRIHSGSIQPTDYLKNIRYDLINFLYKIYRNVEDMSRHLRIIKIIEEATRIPGNIVLKNDFYQFIKDDAKYIASIYRKIIFSNGKLTDELAVAKEIEDRLYWLIRNQNFKITELEILRSDILKDEFYCIFRILVGEPKKYQVEEGWKAGEKKRGKEVDKIFNSINQKNIQTWIDRLNRIATQSDFISEWQFRFFKQLLRKLGAFKPEIAKIILRNTITKKEPLSKNIFVSCFLKGFRDKDRFSTWDDFTKIISESEDMYLTTALVSSLILSNKHDLKKSIREKDLYILEKIVKRVSPFSYLKKENNNYIFHSVLINALMRSYHRAPKKMENLFIKEINRYPNYSNLFFNEFALAIERDWININKFSRETINLLKKMIIQLNELDYDAQNILQKIGQINFSEMMNIFYERIKKDVKLSQNEYIHKEESYKPIPYHFNPSLQQLIADHSEYIKNIENWLIHLTEDWSLYNCHVAHFIQYIGSKFIDIIKTLINKGDRKNLLIAARLMHSIEEIDFDLSIEIVRKTKDRKILRQVEINLYSTGVVSGEYGLANAYEKKAKALEKYKNDKDINARKFVKKMIKSFNEDSIRERQCTDEEKQLRRIEFED